MSGAILYEGPSLLDGTPIVVIMTRGTSNVKTGDLAQTWILRQDMAPHEAVRDKLDAAICGECPLRWSLAKGTGKPLCYVVPYQAPNSVWKAWKRGSYPYLANARIDQGLRLGSYGDPAAVPKEVWPQASYTLGYTHQWRTAEQYKGTLMASVNTPGEAQEAIDAGWKIFATWKGVEDFKGWSTLTVRCPSDPAGQEQRKCDACRLCNGQRANIWIKPH